MQIFVQISAIQAIWKTISRTNKYIDETCPWILAKDETKQQELNNVLYNLIESLRVTGILLKPILINASEELFKQLNIPAKLQTWDSINFGELKELVVTKKPVPLFPRLDKKVEEEYLHNLLNNESKEV